MLHQFGDIAHALKSGISMLGAARLSLLCAKMELYGRAGPFQSGELLFQCYDNLLNPALQAGPCPTAATAAQPDSNAHSLCRAAPVVAA